MIRSYRFVLKTFMDKIQFLWVLLIFSSCQKAGSDEDLSEEIVNRLFACQYFSSAVSSARLVSLMSRRISTSISWVI